MAYKLQRMVTAEQHSDQILNGARAGGQQKRDVTASSITAANPATAVADLAVEAALAADLVAAAADLAVPPVTVVAVGPGSGQTVAAARPLALDLLRGPQGGGGAGFGPVADGDSAAHPRPAPGAPLAAVDREVRLVHPAPDHLGARVRACHLRAAIGDLGRVPLAVRPAVAVAVAAVDPVPRAASVGYHHAEKERPTQCLMQIVGAP